MRGTSKVPRGVLKGEYGYRDKKRESADAEARKLSWKEHAEGAAFVMPLM